MSSLSDLRLFADAIQDELLVPMIQAEEDLHVRYPEHPQVYELLDGATKTGYIGIVVAAPDRVPAPWEQSDWT